MYSPAGTAFSVPSSYCRLTEDRKVAWIRAHAPRANAVMVAQIYQRLGIICANRMSAGMRANSALASLMRRTGPAPAGQTDDPPVAHVDADTGHVTEVGGVSLWKLVAVAGLAGAAGWYLARR